MSETTVGAHDPMVFYGTVFGSPLGVWVECECGWISQSFFTERPALLAHSRHVEAVGGQSDA